MGIVAVVLPWVSRHTLELSCIFFFQKHVNATATDISVLLLLLLLLLFKKECNADGMCVDSVAKTERLKLAKEEAAAEVAQYKIEKEEQFKRSVEDDTASSKQNVAKLSADSQKQIDAIRESADTRRKLVLDMLLNEVKTVHHGQ